MKLRRIKVENFRSFLEPQELVLDGDIGIIIGPNGGGKTNLLDTTVLALRLFLLKSWSPRHNPTPEWPDRHEWVQNDALTMNNLERHSQSPQGDQRIEIELEATETDVASIARATAGASALRERAKERYAGFPAPTVAPEVASLIQAGDRFTYKIVNGSVGGTPEPAASAFKAYLEAFEIESRLRADFDETPLDTPMIFLPINRSATNNASSVSLAVFNEYEQKRGVDASHSRLAGAIVPLAIGRLATRLRLLLEKDSGNARTEFMADKSLNAFTRILKSIGYEWSLLCTNPVQNQYDITLKKDGSSFRIGAASSGEREILTYLFAVYALNVRNALIVVDEPEMHLHPRWQRTLLSVFEQLSAETGNQFLMATHSPVFVSPSSIQYVSRVHSERQRSRVTKLGDRSLPEPKHLFSIVNSQNNERVFFCDLVVLVEGISDRIFFEAYLRSSGCDAGTSKVLEVVSVGGKSLFSQYELLLKACAVEYLVVADLDYVREIGTDELKALFSLNAASIKKRVLDDPSSVDAAILLERLHAAIASGDTTALREQLEYIKGRHNRLRTELTEEEKKQLLRFIKGQRALGRHILSNGSLENYLPIGCRGKDLQKVIRLVADPDFLKELPTDALSDLEALAEDVRKRMQVKS